LTATKGRILFISVAVLYALLFPFHGASQVDWTWDYPIYFSGSIAGHYGLRPGIDFSQYTGPLFFLYKSIALPIHNHFIQHTFFVVSLSVLLIGSLVLFIRRTRNYLGPSLILGTIACYLNRNLVSTEVFIIVVSFVAYMEDIQRPKSRLFIFPAVLALMAPFIKLNFGVQLLVLYVLYVGFAHIVKKQTALQTTMKLVVFGICLSGLAFYFYGSVHQIIHLLAIQFEVVAAYAEQNSIPASDLELLLAILQTSLLFVAAWQMRQERSLLYVAFWWAMAVVVICFSFKHSFVAQTSHSGIFWGMMPIVMVTSLLFVRTRVVLGIILLTFMMTGLMGAARGSFYNPLKNITKIGFKNVGLLLNIGGANEIEIEKNMSYIKSQALSEDEIKTIGKASVYTVRKYIPSIYGAELNWHPPMFALYYDQLNAKLDKVGEAYWSSDRAPEFFIMSWESRDAYHPLYTSPAAYYSILDRYGFVSQVEDRLLLKKSQDTKFVKKFIGSAMAQWGEAIPIPYSDHIIIAELHIELTPIGKFMKSLLRVPPTFIRLLRENGQIGVFRFNRMTAVNGLMMSLTPSGLDQFGSLARDGTIHPAARRNLAFKVYHSSNLPYYSDPFRVEFFEVQIPNKLHRAMLSTMGLENYLVGLKEVDSDGEWADISGVWTGGEMLFEGQSFKLKDMLYLSGWVEDHDGEQPYKDLLAEVDGKYYEPVRLPRCDITRKLEGDACPVSGFALKLPFAPKDASYKIYIRHHDGLSYRVIQGRFKDEQKL
jgi:hypothetical protein